MEFAKKEVEDDLDVKPVSFSDFKVLTTGNRHDQRDFTFSEKFSLDGLVKKAGNNYIVNIGNLIGGQIQVKDQQRQRKYNVYMPYPRTLSYTIRFAIPEGYVAEGIENLNRSVENETGSFISKAVMETNKVVVTVNKTYKHSFEEAADWNKLLLFLDTAYDFSQQKILLKKK